MKPLDFTNVIRHAFMCGRASAKHPTHTDEQAWVGYDPEPGAFGRVTAALRNDPPVVKPLVWVKCGAEYRSSCGEFRVYKGDAGDWVYTHRATTHHGFDGPDSAKDGANEENEQRVLDKLE